ncbi:uncharacterized protein LOC119106835 [Pollicipes pollicipes]|uniref:uncharacterized protein LOC119106835 n=1 Tax=Pollicipes pollicipes TaxID=41117 RepID=UPI001884BE69|nr:uncharacterized protein LOC119106835 [Pollicipes pollicipes]XP_037086070.1 uncharacterized protein LOC119106835 [Pollicipes pollicipes]XP_037086071.1 uncharacterized protein LOC119106835 [Pollicipes pollicipes]XP_037086072.1 uncharacterized protein LOC119106835 [Pollicipes pollicipes]
MRITSITRIICLTLVILELTASSPLPQSGGLKTPNDLLTWNNRPNLATLALGNLAVQQLGLMQNNPSRFSGLQARFSQSSDTNSSQSNSPNNRPRSQEITRPSSQQSFQPSSQQSLYNSARSQPFPRRPFSGYTLRWFG